MKILFLSNHFITLYAFRKELICKLLSESYDVYLSLPKDDNNVFFEKMGCHLINTNIERRGINPFKDIVLVVNYYKIIKSVKPDIILSYTIKPNIYGSIASRCAGINQICNITGTGTTFQKNGIISFICKLLYRISVKKSYKVFFQNQGDKDFFEKNGLVGNNFDIIPGSGVNVEEHPFVEMPPMDHLNFIYIGRVMKLKGIDDYLECAKRIHTKHPNTTFYIAGWNEEPIYMRKVEEAQQQGYVEYLGFRRDIKDWISKCHCIIHPAHGGEGMSNVMLECASMGRVCIASNIYGCKEIVDDGKTGFLYRLGEIDNLVKKIELFIHLSDTDKKVMGKLARKMVEKNFDRNIVVAKYMQQIVSL